MTTQMKPIVEKILKSGLVDKHMAQMMERWGNLPSGASDLIPEDEDHLKKATKEQLDAMVEDIGDEVAKLQTIKETQLDLDRLRWPTKVTVFNEVGELMVTDAPAVIDRMNRLYFRLEDINEAWFVPGFTTQRAVLDKGAKGSYVNVKEQILEITKLYFGEQPVCLQVFVQKVA